jgi:midasin (ATPase involved in ribosome maturation)
MYRYTVTLRTGKRLNMRKIIPFIASDFKKDKIWLRRTKPNKREFQILVALGKGLYGRELCKVQIFSTGTR